jgi:microcystin-dependent protein
MGTPYLGELKIVAFNFAPKGWALCNGQFLPINQNQALFSLLGTMYGGNGQTTFALPDLRGRTPIHVGNGNTQGQAGGEVAHTVSIAEMPTHTHVLNGTSTAGTAPIPLTNLLGTGATQLYSPPANPAAMNVASVGNTGGSQPHENRQPYSVLNFAIALQGIFPSQN